VCGQEQPPTPAAVQPPGPGQPAGPGPPAGTGPPGGSGPPGGASEPAGPRPAADSQAAAKSSFFRDLRSLWQTEPGFRRLLLTRLVSQTGDGAFTVGLGTYVFFNATSFPDPVTAAGAFAVLYVPYSIIGPFAGVFIDRWSRRQILVWSAVVRACFVTITAALVASGTLGLPLYSAALLVLGVNRFFLASLPASVPHVVPPDKLVMANGVSPSAGGIMSAVGSLIALGVHVATGGGQFGSAVTMLAAGCLYLLAGAVALTMRRDQLGPDRTDSGPRQVMTELAAIGRAIAEVGAGLIAGLRYLRRRRAAAAALVATGGNKLFYGILFLMAILLFRNYFYPGNANSALSHFGSYVVVPGAIGYALAAIMAPAATRRFGKAGWIIISLVAAALVTGALGWTFEQLLFAIIAFGLNVAGQSISISAVTIIQEEVADSFRGRVFSLFDMMSNVPLAAGAAISAVFMPTDGKSLAVVAVVAGGYLVVAGSYWLLVRGRPVTALA
jgi:MFS family permease